MSNDTTELCASVHGAWQCNQPAGHDGEPRRAFHDRHPHRAVDGDVVTRLALVSQSTGLVTTPGGQALTPAEHESWLRWLDSLPGGGWWSEFRSMPDLARTVTP